MAKDKEISFVGILTRLLKHRTFIITNFLIVSIVAVIISLLLPKWYKAGALIMPPMTEGGLGFSMGMAGQIAGMMMGGSGDYELPMFATPSDVYEMILKSRGVADNLIEKYDLMDRYGRPTIEETRKELGSHTFIEVGKEGSISVSFEAKEDPELAADVVNSYVEALDEANKRVKIVRAKNSRLFLEERLSETKIDLKAAEDSLRAFQERYNTVSIEDQVTAAVNNAAQLMAMKQVYEVKLQELEQTMAPSHSEIRETKVKINAVNNQIREMKYGDRTGMTRALMKDTDMFPPFVNVPELGLEYARRMRDLKIQEIIFELLTQQYEQEKIQEARKSPTVVVLDQAVPPTKKSRPKRAIIVALAALLSLFFSLFVVFVREYMEDVAENDPAEYQRIQALKTEFRSIFKRRRNN